MSWKLKNDENVWAFFGKCWVVVLILLEESILNWNMKIGSLKKWEPKNWLKKTIKIKFSYSFLKIGNKFYM